LLSDFGRLTPDLSDLRLLRLRQLAGPHSDLRSGRRPTIMRYRRLRVPGGTYFFTLVTHERRPIFADPTLRELMGVTDHFFLFRRRT